MMISEVFDVDPNVCKARIVNSGNVSKSLLHSLQFIAVMCLQMKGTATEVLLKLPMPWNILSQNS
ncbi:Crossover junction endodeoxyribonuclease RuvC [Frankliniella fusca]|uniref:Crossover junction endodeoxyribonuclease RuvC n=1 Tax=Frankliniella fusca TaxID=407009 RepID=A0AAE1HXX0_9NEOP|nr:Crossover junction endodeoxyribonuclease RuvC [Frankliniella fusca]